MERADRTKPIPGRTAGRGFGFDAGEALKEPLGVDE